MTIDRAWGNGGSKHHSGQPKDWMQSVILSSDPKKLFSLKSAGSSMSGYRVLDRCNICHSTRYRPFAVGVASGELHFVMVRCLNCGLFFANPMATEAEIFRFYESDYYGESHRHLQEDSVIGRIEFARENWIPEFKRWGHGANFLEIGCGPGPVVRAAKDAGYNAIGLELNELAARFASQELSLDVRRQTLEDSKFPASTFDIIFAWHVIEHVLDLKAFLEEIHRILKPDGVFIFGTENYLSLRICFERAFHWITGNLPSLNTATEHTFMLTPQLVSRVFPKLGFAPEKITVYQDNPENKFFAAVQSANPVKRSVHYGILATIYGISQLLPVGGKMKVVARKKLLKDAKQAVGSHHSI